jgi:hypothetical protein
MGLENRFFRDSLNNKGINIWCKSALRQIVNISVLIVYIQANPKGMGYNCAMISPNMEE